ncbi:hypothetical protein [Type-E symbiont of Plautia stali]|uniref:hypothetical protein n=1 Tax=Type-E symbiont of Plautia stali TaxID=1560357 RepID=UPI00128EEA73|nr:hypothetical protein [Type-E symbiont of Plautia stali]
MSLGLGAVDDLTLTLCRKRERGPIQQRTLIITFGILSHTLPEKIRRRLMPLPWLHYRAGSGTSARFAYYFVDFTG